ncbi:MAG: tetratricopeptide repeat protein [Spirochaetes bacterium]|nr:tetratricopeptide repeat protein [Spirochaetota bacterium]
MSALPTGTVTFLFTDIQESTRLWQNFPEEMRKSLSRHDDILRTVIQNHDGYIFKTVGDAFCAAFHTALDGINAALKCQLLLQKETWTTPKPLLVRMILHTGEAEERGKDYYGQTLNRAARMESTGHGGQILISLVTAELVRDSLPDKTSLKDLGIYRLKDLTRPESIFQLLHPDLPVDFPPLKSLDVHIHNLPIQPTPLIGREKEQEIIKTMLSDGNTRVVTLTGPGGIGKTRLALQTAAENIEYYRHGVFFVDLSSVFDTKMLMPVIAETLHIKEFNTNSAFRNITEYLKDKHVLLVLDNFEQIINAELQIVNLFKECPFLKILITSREPLHVRGEKVFAIPPLTFPKPEQYLSIERLTQFEAVRLFIGSALSVKQDFQITNDNAPSVAEICSRLDGIPLAIELAAARIKLLSPNAILKRLEHSLNLLTSGAHDLPLRQRTLRATISWSYDQLDNGLKKSFRTLSVFRGKFDLDAAEFILIKRAGEEYDILDGIESLVDKSLLIQTGTYNGEPSFHILETIRDYGREKLKENNEIEAVMKSYTDYFLKLAETAFSNIEGRDQAKWLNKLNSNTENLRSALGWLSKTGDCNSSLKMAGFLWRFWQIRGYLTQGRNTLTQILDRCADSEEEKTAHALVSQALLGAGVLARHQGDYTESEKLLKKCMLIHKNSNKEKEQALILHELGWTNYRNNKLDEAFEYFNSCKTTADKLKLPILKEKAEMGLGTINWRKNNISEAEAAFKRCIKIFSKYANYRNLAQATGNLAILAAQKGNIAEAEKFFKEAAGIYEKLADRDNLKITYNNLGYMSYINKDYSSANKYYDKLLKYSRESGDIRLMSTAKIGLAGIFLRIGYIRKAEETAQEALKDVEELEGGIEEGAAYRVLGEVNINLGDIDRAKAFFKKSIELLNKTGDKEELDIALKLYKEIEKK